MFKKLNKKGFTLAELLIVVAIIGVLVAISIPIFTAQLNKARCATNQANARSAKAAAISEYLMMDEPAAMTYDYDAKTGEKSTSAATNSVGSGNLDINAWSPTSISALGEKVYDKWTISIDADGKIDDIKYS